ncbi:MAG: hypothetical protein M1335_02870, partial [Chloroflexi bacterium]|nr:hypothetical protein [Chloroflexota bacterium]
QNFGSVRGQSKVYFTPISVTDQGQPAAQIPNPGNVSPASDRFSGCGCDFNYVNWTDKEINMYVPDGATSGNVTVLTDKGTSNSAYFEVAGQVGTKVYKDRRGYQIEYGMQISNVVADPTGTIDVWMPALSEDLSQRDIQRVLNPKPLWDDFRGLSFVNASVFFTMIHEYTVPPSNSRLKPSECTAKNAPGRRSSRKGWAEPSPPVYDLRILPKRGVAGNPRRGLFVNGLEREHPTLAHRL